MRTLAALCVLSGLWLGCADDGAHDLAQGVTPDATASGDTAPGDTRAEDVPMDGSDAPSDAPPPEANTPSDIAPDATDIPELDGSNPPVDVAAEVTEPEDTSPPPVGASDWFQSFGGEAFEEVKAVTADSVGNVYVAGIFQGTLAIGTETFEHSEPGSSTPDAFVASYGPDGAFRWAHAYGAPGADTPFEISVDSADRVYVAGSHHGDLMVGDTPLLSKGEGDADLFVVVYDIEGAQLWAKNWGGPFSETPRDVSVNPAGDIFVTGSFTGSIVADGVSATTEVGFGVSEVFVLAIDGESHEALWIQAFTGVDHDVGTALVADNTRNAVVAVSYRYDLTLDAEAGLAFDNGGDGFDVGLVRLDEEGEVLWAKPFGGAGDEEIIGLDLDPVGHIFATGVFSETADFGGPPLVGVADHDIMVASYAASGDHLWSVAFAGAGFDQALDLEVEGDGIYLTGRFTGDLNLGGLSLDSPGDYDVFVGRLSTADGAASWAMALGSGANDQANGIGLAGDGGIFVGGHHDGAVTFDGATIAPASSESIDAFVLRLTE